MYAYIFTLMGHDSGADDVFQEASTLAWEKFSEFRPGTDFLAWICQIARFRVLSYFDAKRRRPMPFSDASEIAVSGPDDGTITVANGFGSHGEMVKRIRDSDGQVRGLRFGGGTLVPEDRVAAELRACEADA